MSVALDGMRYSMHLSLKGLIITPRELERKARRLEKKRAQVEKLYGTIFDEIEVTHEDRLWMLKLWVNPRFHDVVKKWHLSVLNGVRYEQYKTWAEALTGLDREARLFSHYIEILHE